MALLAAVVLPALPLEDDDLAPLAVPHDLAGDGRAIDDRCAHRHAVVGARDQHLVERDRLTHVRCNGREADGEPGLGAKLLVATAEDRVHESVARSTGSKTCKNDGMAGTCQGWGEWPFTFTCTCRCTGTGRVYVYVQVHGHGYLASAWPPAPRRPASVMNVQVHLHVPLHAAPARKRRRARERARLLSPSSVTPGRTCW